MSRRPRASSRHVLLVGVENYQQGDHDSLCAYYTGAMLLASLRPEFKDSFETSVRENPVFSNMTLYGQQERHHLLTSWFERGHSLGAVCDALNKACAQQSPFYSAFAADTSFSCAPRNFTESNALFEDIKLSIDAGLPCALAWYGERIGEHAVVVSGYATYSGSLWLLLEDPSGDTEIEWDQLERLSRQRVDLVTCMHNGFRPDQQIVHRDKDGEVVFREYRRWNREKKAYDTVFKWPAK